SFDPQGHLQTQTDEQIKDTEDSNEEWTMSQTPESHVNQKTKQMETEADGVDCGESEPDNNLVHTEDLNRTNRPFVCSVCGVRFTTKFNLRSHMRVHTGERPFSCLVCHKQFKYKNNIRFHMVIHTGEKLFCCSVCGVRFTTKSNLIRHTASHTVEKPFSCSVCQKTFKQKGHVQRHMKVHNSHVGHITRAG
uniref:C2H2-type domain-containing protein n=1 Tax=Sphaeramia orbicularis TaxID=375764 RepID=A0A672ZBG5_9TELE